MRGKLPPWRGFYARLGRLAIRLEQTGGLPGYGNGFFTRRQSPMTFIKSPTLLAGCAALALAGCVNPNAYPDNPNARTQNGAIIGGMAGALLGAQSDEDRLAKAVVGGAIGAALGGAIGQTLDQQGIKGEVTPPYFSVKEAVFPFVKFPGVDTILGPEMKSTGEVMGVGKTFGEAFVKSQLGAGTRLPRPVGADGKPSGKVFLTVKNGDKPRAVKVARDLVALGFELVATKGTAAAITAAGVACQTVNKVTEGRPHVVDMIKNNEIVMVVNTVEERRNAIADSRAIRTSALLARVTTFTTIAGAEAAVEGMKYMDQLGVISVQEMHAQLAA